MPELCNRSKETKMIKLYIQEIYDSCYDCPHRQDQGNKSLCTNAKLMIPKYVNNRLYPTPEDNLLYPIPEWCPLPNV
jgi:hypothetical protein